MALIDKETIRAEIERRREYGKFQYDHIPVGLAPAHYFKGVVDTLEEVLAFLDTIPDNSLEGLDAEIDKEIDKLDITPGYDKLAAFARHFAEWGAEHKAIEIFKEQNCQGCGTQRCTGKDEWLEGCREFQKWREEYLKK